MLKLSLQIMLLLGASANIISELDELPLESGTLLCQKLFEQLSRLLPLLDRVLFLLVEFTCQTHTHKLTQRRLASALGGERTQGRVH